MFLLKLMQITHKHSKQPTASQGKFSVVQRQCFGLVIRRSGSQISTWDIHLLTFSFLLTKGQRSCAQHQAMLA